MFGKTVVADSLVAWVVGGVLSGAKNKILSKIHGNERPENYEAEIYNVTENTIRNICMIRDKEALPELVETFLSKILNENTVSTSTIKKSLKSIAGDMVIDDEFCEYFRRRLYGEISRNDKLSHWLQLNMITGIVSNIGTVLDGVEEVNNKLDEFVGFASNRDASEMANAILKFDDDKQYYIDGKWNARLFLHIGENDKPLTLENTFIVPDYKCEGKDCYDLKDRLDEFINYGKGTMIIFGVPGMGKTSITAYLANKYEDTNDVIVLRLKKLSDSIDKEGEIVDSICKELGNCTPFDLRNRVLILDGYDELNYKGDKQKLIKSFISRVDNIIGLKVMVTSRMNYIDIGRLRDLKVQTIFLKSYSAEKIRFFYYNILDKSLDEKIEIQNEDVMGIPVILYMALTVGIDITDKLSKCEIYERVFSLEKGIYNRFRGINKEGYEMGTHMLQIEKENYYKILQLLAFVIFETNGMSVEEDKYIEIVNSVLTLEKGGELTEKKVIFDFPIKDLYETSGGIEFVHKSIYEYFVAEYIYQELKQAYLTLDEIGLIKKLSDILKNSILSDEIKDCLQYKFLNNDVFVNESSYYINAFEYMLSNGMIYATGACLKNGMECEQKVFFNMLELLHFWTYEKKIRIKNMNNFCFYLKHFANNGINLSEFDLSEGNLEFANLPNAKLIRANLTGAKLAGANLEGANLEGAILENASFFMANLTRSNLNTSFIKNTSFCMASLINAVINNAHFGSAILNGTIFSKRNVKNIERYQTILKDIRISDYYGSLPINYEEYHRIYKGQDFLFKNKESINMVINIE